MLGVLSALVAADVAGCSRRELLALLVAPVHRLHEHNANAHHIKQVRVPSVYHEQLTD